MEIAALILAGLLGGGGVIGAIYNWYTFRKKSGRQGTLDFWDTYLWQAESAEKRGDTDDASRIRKEYEGQLEAWRAKQSFERVAPRNIPPVKEAPSRTADEIDERKRLLDESLALSPSLLSAQDYLLRGNTYYEDGQYETALAAFERAIELSPDDPDVSVGRGAALSHLGHYEEAFQAFEDTLRLKPGDPVALNNRGVVLAHLERYEDAQASLEQALRLLPDRPYIIYNRAGLFSLWGKSDEALEDLEQVVGRDHKYRELARADPDFQNIRFDPRFCALIEADRAHRAATGRAAHADPSTKLLEILKDVDQLTDAVALHAETVEELRGALIFPNHSNRQ